jgi:hypothetical protein
MEWVLALILSWPAIIGLFVIALCFEHNERHGWTTVFTTIALIALVAMFKLPWQQIGFMALAWLPIGLIWSMWRWRRRCSNIIELNHSGELHKDMAEHKLAVENNFDVITYWTICWPVSFLEAFVGDIIDFVSNLIRKMFRSTYERMSAKAKSQLK